MTSVKAHGTMFNHAVLLQAQNNWFGLSSMCVVMRPTICYLEIGLLVLVSCDAQTTTANNRFAIEKPELLTAWFCSNGTINKAKYRDYFASMLCFLIIVLRSMVFCKLLVNIEIAKDI